MASKFSEFLDKNKLDTRRIVAASKKLERLRPQDRAQKLALRRSKAAGAAAPGAPAEGAEAKKPEKRHTGRPVTPRLVESVRLGKPISGPAKTRLVRAVNRILEQKKQKPVDVRALF
jgi:hypothetical protein